MQTYLALDVAAITLKVADKENIGITNLRLNKLLFLMNEKYLKEYNIVLFSDDIEWWRHGPVIRDVYFKYRHYITSPISIEDSFLQDTLAEITFDSSELEEFALSVIQEYSVYNDWDLVNFINHRRRKRRIQKRIGILHVRTRV